MLPPNENMPSVFVRALCLEGFEPSGYKFIFLRGQKEQGNKLKRKILRFIHYIKILIVAKKSGHTKYLYFIKPHSLLILIVARLFLGFKVYIDVNDPLHLSEHLGTFSRFKFWAYMKICTGAVFESEEYADFNKEFNEKIKIIEDTPQFEIAYTNYRLRKEQVVWFGSPEASKDLIKYIELFKKFNVHGVKIVLLGVDSKIISIFKSEKIDFVFFDSYSHSDLINILGESFYSFVPMPNIPLYSLRGNLKVKFAMASGCIVIASDLNMHKRLIENRIDGFIFENDESFDQILKKLKSCSFSEKEEIGRKANLKIVNSYSRMLHAEKICQYISPH